MARSKYAWKKIREDWERERESEKVKNSEQRQRATLRAALAHT